MKRLISVIATSGVLLTGVAIAAPSAMAGERICRGSIGAVTLDDVKVPAGASCTLTGTTLKGNVKVEKGATLHTSKARVNGNIQSQGHKYVNVLDTRVGGSIQLEQGSAINLRRNIVNGDIQLFSNRTGTKYVYNNTVGGNLQCKSNTPAPVGSGNKVKGNKEDQCRRL